MRLIVVQKIQDGFGLRTVELRAWHGLHFLYFEGPQGRRQARLQAGVETVASPAFIAEYSIVLLDLRGKTSGTDFDPVSVLSEGLKLSEGQSRARGADETRERHSVEQPH